MKHILKLIFLSFILLGCVQYQKNFRIGAADFRMPEQFTIVKQNKDLINSPIPDQKPTTEYFISLKNSKKQNLYIFYWEGNPAGRDRGPISIEKLWVVSTKNRKLTVYQTDIFLGKKQRVLTASFSVSNNGNVLIYSPDIELEEFKRILSNIEIN